MKHLWIPCILALACSDPGPEDVLRCKAQVFRGTNELADLLQSAEPVTSQVPDLGELIAIGLTAAEAQIILTELDRCLQTPVTP